MRCRSFIATGLSLVAVLASLINPSTVSAQASGLVAAYGFNEGTGTTTADISGNNNTGALNATTWTAAGQFGSALVFNGNTSFVNLNNPASLQLTGSMTVSAWIKSAAFPGDDAAIVSKRSSTEQGYQLDTTVDTGPRTIGFKLTSASGPLMARYGATALQLNQWYHVAGVYDATARTLNVYLNGALNNGTLIGTVSATQLNSSVNANIGVRPGASAFAFNGTIDEVRIYSRALSQAEIQADMTTPVGGTPDTTAPTAPTGLSATAAASGTQIDLAWTASTDNTGVTGYQVERCQGASCTSFAQIATPTTTSFSDTGLTGSTSYSYRVRAADAAGNLSAYSNTVTATTPAAPDTTPPSAPSVISAAVVGASEIDVSWTASTDNVGVTGYQVDRCQGTGCTSFAQIATPTATSYNDVGLAAGTTYRYRVRATDAAGNVSANSSIVTATTQAAPDITPPTAPSALSAAASSATQINLVWVGATDNVGVTGYLVERCQGTGCGAFAQIAAPSATSFGDAGLTAGTSYSYRVRAVDAAGNLGPYSNITSATTQAPDTTAPTAPGGLSATAASSAQINLAWTASTDNVAVTGYLVERCQGANCTTFAQIAAPTVTSFNNTGLAAGTSYSYRVRATDAAGNLSAYSSVASATTSNTPSGLVAAYGFNEGTGTTTADISGNNNTGALNATTWTAAGQFGSALVFNGSTSFVNLNNPASLQLTGSMTVSAWIKSAAFPGDDAAIVSKRSSTEQGYQLDTTVDTGPRTIGFKLSSASGPLMARYGATALQLNQWYHVAGVYDATARTLNVYLNGALNNGTLIGTVSATQLNSSVNANIGVRPGASGFTFNGTIDEVRIYNRALSQAEIQADMTTPVGGTPDTTAPTAPTGLSATAAASGTQIDLAWTASTDNTGVTGYQVERCQGASCTSFAQIATPTTTSFSDTGLTGSTSYSYRVRAADAAGNLSAYSNTVTATTPAAPDTTPPSAPSVISAAVVGASEIDVSWTASTDNVGVTGYQVDRCQGTGCTSFAQIATPTATSYNDVGLAAATVYRYRVRATDAAGNVSANSSIVTATTQAAPDITPPSAPTGLSATAVSATQVNLAWVASTDNVGVTGYRVERCQGTPCIWVQIGTPTATSFNDTGLTAATTYSYWVRATDAAGNLSPWSSIVTVTTPNSDTTAPTAPGGLSATAASSAQINLAWTASTDNVAVTGYLVERCQGANCTTFAQIAAPTVTSFNNTGLAAGTSYSYRVRATDAAGNLSAYSSVASATTSNTPSGLVAAYGFNEGTGTTTADISGNNNTGALNATTWTAAGQFGSALVFNGSTSFVNLNNPASLQLTGSMTVSAWIKSAAFPGDDAAIVSKRSSTEQGYQLDTTVDTGPRTIGFKLSSASGPLMARYGATALQLNQWYHVAGVYDATARTLNVYLNGALNNGTLIGTVSATQLNSSVNANIGVRPGASGFTFNGTIDEVRIYNRALSQAEIQADMTTPVGGILPQPDSIPPSVTLTSPAAGASVTSVVSVSANATDNVGVASVRFFLDGAPFGAAVTAPPYAIAWNSPASSLGNHVLTATATDFAGNSATSAPVSVTVVAPSLSTSGQWAAPVTWPIVAVHSNLLWTGQVLASDGQGNGNDARLWDPATGVFTSVTNSQTNMFCSGHCQLADGRVIVVGGHAAAHTGLPDTNLFNPATSTWTRVAPMAVGRWYPTVTTLPDGRVLVNSGEINCNGCFAPIPEVYDPQANVWTQLTAASMIFPYYPHIFVLPDGRVLAAATAEDAIVSRVLNLGTQTWSIVDPTPVDGGSSVMYAPGKIMKSGRSVDPDAPVIPSTPTTYVLDMNEATPAWRQTGAMAFARTYHTLTLLPDGTVLATGGGPTTDAIGVGSAILSPELWSPVTETWTTLSSMQKPRLYHSGALLMPDARVLVLGGGRFNGVNEPTDQLSSEFLSPPYLFKGPRPTITSAPVTATYGGTITVQTPDAASIGSVSIVKLGSVTHAFNQNQLIAKLPFTAFSGGINVQAPANSNIATPGYYMLFILNTNGVPSVAAIVRIQ